MIPKFRAWDKYEEELVGNIYWIDEYESLNKVFEDERYIFMQSTGLVDKSGVEIYEGDVVKCYHLRDGSLSEYIGRVVFVDYGWYVVDSKDTYDPFYNYMDCWTDEIFEIEVIGNVWEYSE